MTVRAGRLLTAAVLVTLAMLGAVACTTLRVGADYDHQAPFGTYKRFALLPRAHTGANPLVEQRARDAVQAGLSAKGYEFVDDPAKADIAVDVTIGSRDRTDIQSYPMPYAGPWYGPGWWGYPYWGNSIDVRQYREGTLSIDMFATRTHRPVWHGWAKKELSHSDIEHPGPGIREAVDEVLAAFPPS